MKKLALVLTICMLLGATVSCGQPEAVKEEVKTEKPAVADSASEEYVLTEEVITKTLDKLYADEVSAGKDRALSADKNVAKVNQAVNGVPAYLSKSKVDTLGTGDYSPYYKEFNNYRSKAFDAINDLVSKLPDKCDMNHSPEWIVNAVPYITRYVVLDPSKITAEDTDELVLFLERECYRIAYDDDFDSYYDVDMTELEERFSDIGTVLVKMADNWAYYDPAAKTLEQVEYFPGFNDIYKAYRSVSSTHVNEHIEEVLGDEGNIR